MSDLPTNPPTQDGEAPQGNSGRSLTLIGDPEPRDEQPDAPTDQTERLKALFEWAMQVLEAAGLLKAVRGAKTREEIDDIKFDVGIPAIIMAISDALHGKSRAKHFRHLNDKKLEGILRNRFTNYKKDERKKLIENEQQAAAEEEAREKREEDVKFYGEFGEYKSRDRGSFKSSSS